MIEVKEEGLTFTLVEDRLIEAWGFLHRLPDREAGWTRLRSFWPEVQRHTWWGDYPDMETDAPRRLPGLRTAEVDRMEEALDWLRHVEPRDRKLIALVLRQLQREEDARPSWVDVATDWRREVGDPVMADALRKRYDRAIMSIAQAIG